MAPLYVVSDVHGHLDDLVAALADLGLVALDGCWAGSDDVLWFLGDLLDRGPDGAGVVDLVMSLQEQAPGQVHMLMGNHEALALGMKRFPRGRFADSWQANGGQARDQDALTDKHVSWLASLPLVAKAGDHLLVHSDTTAYLTWGATVEEINATVTSALAVPEDERSHWQVWARLTTRFHFAGDDGPSAARHVLSALGGRQIVHGHSIIGSLLNRPSDQVTGPLRYADGRVLAVDGGRYAGGPLLVVRLE